MSGEAPDRYRLVRRTLEVMHARYPDADCALHYLHVHELLFATILSALLTDATFDRVTEQLFKKYPTDMP